jgi:hypothetical protein
MNIEREKIKKLQRILDEALVGGFAIMSILLPRLGILT